MVTPVQSTLMRQKRGGPKTEGLRLNSSLITGSFRKQALQLMEDITQRGKTPLLVGGTMLYFKPWSRTLLPVTNRGKTFHPPKEHLGVRLENVSPLDVANAAISFYCKLYNDVLTKVYGVVPKGTQDL